MAHKPTSFKLVEKGNKKTIVIYTNVEAKAEQQLINFYLTQGYAPMCEEKKDTKKIADMRKDFKNDEETLKKFNDAYAEKNGFFNACKVYNAWKKDKKKQELEAYITNAFKKNDLVAVEKFCGQLEALSEK